MDFAWLHFMLTIFNTGKGVDYGFDLPIIFEYVFPAGSNCSSTDGIIKIIDDVVSEAYEDERFVLRIINYSLPYGVEIDSESESKEVEIFIEDNDCK